MPKLKDKGLKYNSIHGGNIWLTHVDHHNFYFDLKVYFYCFSVPRLELI
jgi:hypothetical protein